MKKLWKIYIVDPESELIVTNLIIAKSYESALVKVFSTEPRLDKSPDDYHIFREVVGEFED